MLADQGSKRIGWYPPKVSVVPWKSKEFEGVSQILDMPSTRLVTSNNLGACSYPSQILRHPTGFPFEPTLVSRCGPELGLVRVGIAPSGDPPLLSKLQQATQLLGVRS